MFLPCALVVALDPRSEIVGLTDVGDWPFIAEFVRLIADQDIDARPRQFGPDLDLAPSVPRNHVTTPGPVHAIDDPNAVGIAARHEDANCEGFCHCLCCQPNPGFPSVKFSSIASPRSCHLETHLASKSSFALNSRPGPMRQLLAIRQAKFVRKIGVDENPGQGDVVSVATLCHRANDRRRLLDPVVHQRDRNGGGARLDQLANGVDEFRGSSHD